MEKISFCFCGHLSKQKKLGDRDVCWLDTRAFNETALSVEIWSLLRISEYRQRGEDAHQRERKVAKMSVSQGARKPL